jgi:hypothetical protein
VAALGHKNVCGLDVAMDDALAVGRIEAIGNLSGKHKKCLVIERLARNQMLQRFAIQKFHGDKHLLVLLANFMVLADFMNGADVRMIQGRGSPRLPAETLKRLRVPRKLVGQKLESYKAT